MALLARRACLLLPLLALACGFRTSPDPDKDSATGDDGSSGDDGATSGSGGGSGSASTTGDVCPTGSGPGDSGTGTGSAGPADLPSGWEDAPRIPGLTQNSCDAGGVPTTGYDERARFTGCPGFVHVVYSDAYFRCAQDVEGFARRSNGAVDILVQPIDMSGDSAAGCDCLYDIIVDIGGLSAGDYEVSLFRRGDHEGSNDDLVHIATATATVE